MTTQPVEAVDHVEEMIEALIRQLSTDDSGEQFVTLQRGDGRRLVRLPTFHELLVPHLEELAPLLARPGGYMLSDQHLAERERIREQRAQYVADALERRRADIAAYVEGD